MALTFRLASEADRPAVLQLFEAAFKAKGDPADLAWKYDRCPYRGTSVIATDGELALGFIGALGTRYRGAGLDAPGNSVVDVMTRADARALGKISVFKRLGDVFRRVNAEAGTPYDFGFPNARAQKIEERLFGCVMIEPCGEWGRPLATPPLLGRLRRRLLRVREGEALGRPHEALAEVLHARPGWRTDRSASTLAWRFSRPGFRYRTFQLLDLRGHSRGYAVTSVRDGRVLLVDLQVGDEKDGTLVDLLAAVLDRVTGAPAERVVLRSPRGGLLARRMLGELGFAEEPTDTVLLMHPIAGGHDLIAAGRVFDYRFSDHDVF